MIYLSCGITTLWFTLERFKILALAYINNKLEEEDKKYSFNLVYNNFMELYYNSYQIKIRKLLEEC